MSGSAKTSGSVSEGSSSGGTVVVDCCPQALPTTLFATLSGGCLDGESLPLEHIPTTQSWQGFKDLGCGRKLRVAAECNGTEWGSTVQIYQDNSPSAPTICYTAGSSSHTSAACTPLEVIWSGLTFTTNSAACPGCCPDPDEPFDLTVTE